MADIPGAYKLNKEKRAAEHIAIAITTIKDK